MKSPREFVTRTAVTNAVPLFYVELRVATLVVSPEGAGLPKRENIPDTSLNCSLRAIFLGQLLSIDRKFTYRARQEFPGII